MSSLAGRWLRPFGVGAGLGIACFLAVFVLRLGYFVVFVALTGAALVVLLTRGKGRPAGVQVRAVGLGLLGYMLAMAASYGGLTGRNTLQTFAMSWRESVPDSTGQALVVLEFARFPGNSLSFRSSQLAEDLGHSGSPLVDVTLEVTRDAGCMRGFSVKRIGRVTAEPVLQAFDSFSSESGAASPWGQTPSWCH